jgi:hypothetical protein
MWDEMDSAHGGMRNRYKILGGIPQVSFQISNRNFGDDNKTDPRDIVCTGVDWVKLAQDQIRWRDFVSTLMNIRLDERAAQLFSWAASSKYACEIR